MCMCGGGGGEFVSWFVFTVDYYYFIFIIIQHNEYNTIIEHVSTHVPTVDNIYIYVNVMHT